LKNDLRS
jgi:hypothetical protein